MTRFPSPVRLALSFAFAAGCALSTARAQDSMPGRLFAVTIEGEVRAVADGRMDLVASGDGMIAHRTSIEVGPRGRASFVLSNNTGLSLGAGSRLEILRFEHAPFAADPMHMDEEPTVSKLEARVRGGQIAFCLPSQVFGSTAVLQVPQASVSLRGRRFMVDVNDRRAVLFVVEGLATVFRGPEDRAGQAVGNGQAVTITGGAGPQFPLIEVAAADPERGSQINESLAGACLSRHTVFFAAPTDPRRVVTPPNTSENPNPTVSLDRLP